MSVYTQVVTTTPPITPEALELDVPLLVRTFDSMAAMRGLYPSHACDEAGIRRSIVSHARNGLSRPSIDVVVRMVVWIEQDATHVDLAPYLAHSTQEEE